MCNLYRMTKTRSEVAAWFDVVDAAEGANFGEEVYPGTPGNQFRARRSDRSWRCSSAPA